MRWVLHLTMNPRCSRRPRLASQVFDDLNGNVNGCRDRFPWKADQPPGEAGEAVVDLREEGRSQREIGRR